MVMEGASRTPYCLETEDENISSSYVWQSSRMVEVVTNGSGAESRVLALYEMSSSNHTFN